MCDYANNYDLCSETDYTIFGFFDSSHKVREYKYMQNFDKDEDDKLSMDEFKAALNEIRIPEDTFSDADIEFVSSFLYFDSNLICSFSNHWSKRVQLRVSLSLLTNLFTRQL